MRLEPWAGDLGHLPVEQDRMAFAAMSPVRIESSEMRFTGSHAAWTNCFMRPSFRAARLVRVLG